MAPKTTHPTSAWLSRYATFVAVATLGLIALGGLVTSHGAGMAVPDWPTTYGYNMFLFPISQWVGGIFYEHTHRLYASAIGFLTIILAVWLHWRGGSRRLARLGWVALGLVVLQGVLGGLRVSLMKDQIGIAHAALAQAFLVLLTLLALWTSARWRTWRDTNPGPTTTAAALGSTYRWVLGTTVVIFLQLVLGATMRHQHAGLAIPDFPLAYGHFWPPTDEAFLQGVNALRTDTRDFRAISAFHIQVHMAHRLAGLTAAVLVVLSGLRVVRAFGRPSWPGRLGLAWMVLIGIQVLLGAWTVWSNKAADIATFHVVVGAACLGIGAVATALCAVKVPRCATVEAPRERRLAGENPTPRSDRRGAGISVGLTPCGPGAESHS